MYFIKEIPNIILFFSYKMPFVIFPLKQTENSITGQNDRSIFQNKQKINFPARVRSDGYWIIKHLHQAFVSH